MSATTRPQKEAGMPGFLEPIWETVFRVATWSALIFGALSIGSAFISAWVGWEITDATQKDADKRIKAADERIAESNARTREAELKLEQLRKLAGPRGINHSIFEAELKGKPKAPVVIWYLPDSSDGWNFSFQLQVALLSAGWEVGRPIPIPAPETMPWRDMPRAMVAGGQPSGVTVVGTDLEMNDRRLKLCSKRSLKVRILERMEAEGAKLCRSRREH